MRISDWSSDVCSSDLIVIALEAEVANQAHGLGQLIIIGVDGTALHGVEGLGGMEANDFACAEAPDALPFVAAAEGVGCVKHELQPMVVGDGLEFVNRRSTAPRSEERRVGKECVSTRSCRGARCH